MFDWGDAVPTPSCSTHSTLTCPLQFLTNAWVSLSALFACSCSSTNIPRKGDSIRKDWLVCKQFFVVADCLEQLEEFDSWNSLTAVASQ